MWERVKRWGRWLNQHKTKILGMSAVVVAYLQNNLAQLGHFIPLRLEGAVLGVFGVLAFVIGLVNTFASPDRP